MAPLDTNKLNFSNSTLVESKSLAIGYLANLGAPAQTKIFSERQEARDFIFADAYDYYITTPVIVNQNLKGRISLQMLLCK